MLRAMGITVKGMLLMSHMAPAAKLAEQARMMQDFGAEAVVLMDSAGAYTPRDVTEKVRTVVEHLDIDVGFHAHNNLGLAVANSMAAIAAGATIVDVTSRGFGAGAGNAPLELIAANLHVREIASGVDLFGALDAADLAEDRFVKHVPTNDSITITSGIAGVFSGSPSPYAKPRTASGWTPAKS